MKYTCCRGLPSSSRISTTLIIQVEVVGSMFVVSPTHMEAICCLTLSTMQCVNVQHWHLPILSSKPASQIAGR